jgi:molybdenum cofactor cytidylyltransferase
VTGSDRQNVEKELKGLDVFLIHNPHFKEGMSTSIRAVLPFLGNSDGLLFHLGDKPFVTPRSIESVLSKYREGKAKIVLPRFEGKTGHPAMIDASLLRDEIGMLHGDRGLREVIENYKQDVVFIEGDNGNLYDIDTIQTLDRLRERGYRIEESKR